MGGNDKFKAASGREKIENPVAVRKKGMIGKWEIR